MAGPGAGRTSTKRFVGYERVSTARQGRSGLGLAAQRSAIEGYARSRGAEVAANFTGVESGRKADRPELARAIQHDHLTGSTLLIARLDRLSRNAAFLLVHCDGGVRFIACDMPAANDLTVSIMALVAKAGLGHRGRSVASCIASSERLSLAGRGLLTRQVHNPK